MLAGDSVLWPTRDKLYVFDQQTAQPRKVIDLAARGVTGGNLLVADGRLLIATDNELIALGAGRRRKQPNATRRRSAWARSVGSIQRQNTVTMRRRASEHRFPR